MSKRNVGFSDSGNEGLSANISIGGPELEIFFEPAPEKLPPGIDGEGLCKTEAEALQTLDDLMNDLIGLATSRRKVKAF